VKKGNSKILVDAANNEEVFCLAWTTTPWTLPSNLGLTVGANIDYVLVKTVNQYLHNEIHVILAKQLFPKYFTDLFRVYFRTTLKQTQVREQLLQTPLPSLLLNVFFIVSGGMYAAFLLQHFNIAPKFSFWQLWLYSGILLSIIYMMKFAGVWLAGWLFNRNDAAAAYTFIVFMNNKITGIVVLPFLVLLGFGTEKIYPVTLIVSITLVACLFLYRFYLSIGVIRGQAKVNMLHFLLYLSAFEVFPLLILFKWVMSFLK